MNERTMKRQNAYIRKQVSKRTCIASSVQTQTQYINLKSSLTIYNSFTSEPTIARAHTHTYKNTYI